MDFAKLVDIQVPSVDRPFGLHLWPLFNKAFEMAVGYPADEFKFQQGVTPMSTLKESVAFIATYYVIIFSGREVMKNFAPAQLRTLFQIHNFVLTAISAILLALFIEQLAPVLINHGLFYAICDKSGGWTQPLVVLYYVSIPSLSETET
jgi:fatty acid elongase 3